MKRLSFITQFKIEFLLPSTGCRKVLGKMPDLKTTAFLIMETKIPIVLLNYLSHFNKNFTHSHNISSFFQYFIIQTLQPNTFQTSCYDVFWNIVLTLQLNLNTPKRYNLQNDIFKISWKMFKGYLCYKTITNDKWVIWGTG